MKISIFTVHVRKQGLRLLTSLLSLQVRGSLVSDPGCLAPVQSLNPWFPVFCVAQATKLPKHWGQSTGGHCHIFPMNSHALYLKQSHCLHFARERTFSTRTGTDTHSHQRRRGTRALPSSCLAPSTAPVCAWECPSWEMEPTFHRRSCKHTDFPPLLHTSHSAAHTLDQKPVVQVQQEAWPSRQQAGVGGLLSRIWA